jgi:hypothetical protein
MRLPLSFVLAAASLVTVAAQASLKYDVPKGWTTQPPSSSMRTAQFVLPRAAGDTEDATAVIFFFGQGGGGGVEENLDRWAGQMVQPNGKAGTRAQGKTGTFTTNGLKVTTLDISGTYSAGAMMGGGSAAPKGPARMTAAVVETPGGNYFVRVLGPQKTVAHWESSIDQFLKSLRYQ